MAAFIDIPPNKSPAASTDVQQVILALSGRASIPLSSVISDSVAYALTLKNTDPSGRAMVVFAADGSTVLFSIDASGVKVSHAGGAAQTPVTDIGSTAGMAADGAHVHGTGGYSAAGTSLEALYAAATVTTAINYTVAAGVLYVFCTTGVTVTLPDATTTNRPITIVSRAGSQTVAAAGGTVTGGSTNTSTGAVMNGVVSAGDSISYKSDGANWYAT